MCSLAAAVQGMDETVNNGAQAIYLDVSTIALNQPERTNLAYHITGIAYKWTLYWPAAE